MGSDAGVRAVEHVGVVFGEVSGTAIDQVVAVASA